MKAVVSGVMKAMWCAALSGALSLSGISEGWAVDSSDDDKQHCSMTARFLSRACESQAEQGYWLAVAKCVNVSEDAQRAQCHADARASQVQSERLCDEQSSARRDICRKLGENRHDPAFDPASFDTNFRNLTNPNRFFPLGIGSRRVYRGGTETITVEVLNKTKLIAGVKCIVVRDIVEDDGRLIEATDDWFAQAKDGNVWYCGEEVKNYGSFKGDSPNKPELLDVKGSFKAGRNADKPGVIFLASPRRGELYREEFSLGNAEDVTEVVSTTYAFGDDAELDRFVPQPLAALFCSGDCVVTKNFSPLEPGLFGLKYYAPGIGFFLQVEPDTGQVVQLVSCNFDSRCALLPAP